MTKQFSWFFLYIFPYESTFKRNEKNRKVSHMHFFVIVIICHCIRTQCLDIYIETAEKKTRVWKRGREAETVVDKLLRLWIFYIWNRWHHYHAQICSFTHRPKTAYCVSHYLLQQPMANNTIIGGQREWKSIFDRNGIAHTFFL